MLEARVLEALQSVFIAVVGFVLLQAAVAPAQCVPAFVLLVPG